MKCSRGRITYESELGELCGRNKLLANVPVRQKFLKCVACTNAVAHFGRKDKYVPCRRTSLADT